ncbi:deoxynucleoside kinase [Deinococcus radiodurans]|jgi:Deoxynucleoside kinases|uniref:Deoxyguanosine kinase/deoxyadenosine kinase subunit n=1 Tax=Deinococcus radiodurans (strain ATCC 13939 / DSM 20539 / JCM 16871 / CCUG 27074 / LMG 4051 / NBRC 15346 / NCIMB 9279 / VKM B-1422 / R1) TaxID=243230 RepID=Q9RXL1_DEIRA|nr:deoxynucleoside kinase [Deinococcus radiodurans]AAF09883.1 deoxyguanosine kinase/deoxyadenosine kinase subunit [Deinococcus radiodurans R1 = ATCC 13939 = DSM 20539]ANC72441.1 deoxyguanosine kinase [Deinococcus radiodurans R1 = ATCC 13939 = DSM 20539]QEM72262.1 deoxynucleoside kinase [Deinococcus radiodurans]QIP28505.1 deoxynucleoside kinase [Deinococcus radiodurans]QIP32779.1 deoxynucleoside kinase [Deinococcus radiodurans]
MYVVVEGPIGVGKTSLAQRLAQRSGAELNLEVVEENPFLAKFYEQPQAYAFQVQAFFLLSRFKQLSQLWQPGLYRPEVVSDYLFDKDFIFAAMNLRDAEFDLYQDLYGHLSPRLPTPDLVVYLRADPPELLRRIARRGRPFEHDMKAAYLADLTGRYDDYFRTYAHPHLILEAGNYDFVANEADQQAIFDQIDAALAQAPAGEDR